MPPPAEWGNTMASPAIQPKLSLAHDAGRDAAGIPDLSAIKEAIARAEAETSATLAVDGATRG